MIKSIFFSILFFFVNHAFCSPCKVVDNELSSTKFDLNEHAINHARKMLDRELGSWKLLCEFNENLIAKKLNAIVFNYCKNPTENDKVHDINDLFDNCITACGGRSYVLRGLLAVYDINSRYENIYNIPIQGNHTAIIATINGKDSFFDPTFGTFFTLNNSNDQPLNLDEVKYKFNENDLPNHIFQAMGFNDYHYVALSKINDIYKNSFDSQYLLLSSYIKHEESSSPNERQILLLEANISMLENTFELGCIDAKNSIDASSCFLRQTNLLYSKESSRDYISYNYNVLGYLMKNMKVNILNFSSLIPNKYYKIGLLIDSKRNEYLVLNISSIGNGIILAPNTKQIKIKPGMHKYQVMFKANKNIGSLMLYPEIGSEWTANMYAIKIQQLETNIT